jgi:hypothetical protein
LTVSARFRQNFSGTLFVKGYREEEAMKIRYTLSRLSKEEKDFWEAVLLEEIDMQRWFAVASSRLLGGETFLMLQ